MHASRSPSSIPTFVSKEALDLSLSGSQLLVTKRPSSASPGKCFSRSVSVSVAGDGRSKRNTMSDVSFGSSRSVKNLRRSNSTTHVNQQDNISLSQAQGEDYLALFDSSVDGRKKLAGLSRASPDRTTWNILDDQPRAGPVQSSPRSSGSVDSPTFLKRRDFTANNRSNKAAVGNSVTTILHNNYSEKPLTPKSSNQKPSFNNLLKATPNDEVQMENGSVTKSQKNFSSPTSTSNTNCLSSTPLGSPVLSTRREVTEEEAERFIQQVNTAAVTIQRWYRQHVERRNTNQAALQQILTSKRKEWEERTEEELRVEQRQKRDEDRKRIREEKARLARLVAIQELQQKRPPLVLEVQSAADVELENQVHSVAVGQRRPPRVSVSASPSNNSPVSPTAKAKNTVESNLNLVSDVGELSFRAVSPALSNRRGSHCSQEHEDRKEEDVCVEQRQHQENDQKLTCKERVFMVTQDKQQRKGQRVPDASGAAIHKKPPKFSPSKRIPNSGSKKSLKSPSDLKTKNTDTSQNLVADVSELSLRAISPASSNHRGSHCSQEPLQRSVSVEDQRSGTSSKTIFNELMDTLKLLEQEPQQLCQPMIQQKEKYAWIDEDGDSNSLTTDNLERHGQMSLHPALPDGGALLSEAKLQSIMSFLDEMEKSEQERPRSVTSGSHREGVLSEEELTGVEHASATAAEISTSMMRLKMELEEKKRTVHMLQAALAQQRELTMRHVKDTEKELNRNFKLQKEQYEATVQRHLTFIDQLISDKKALSERCEGVVAELKQVDQKYTKKIAQMQEQHDMVWQILGPLCEEIKKLKDLMSATEKMRREKWIDEKTKKIKEITVKGLEPEIQKLISKHKTELKKLRTLHEAELLQADDRAAQRFVRQCEELRAQLEKEKDEQCQRERELAKQRYDKQFQEEELSLQQQRRRLYQEVAEEKERLAQLAARQRAEGEDLRRHLEENSSVAVRALREELDKSREEQEKRHQVEMKSMQERLEVEKQTWEENYRKKEEAWLLSRERELKDELRRERDKEIELAIWTLEEETSKDKEECERAADNRVKRLREKYEAEMKEQERSERAAVEKQQELRKQQLEMEEELIRLQSSLRQHQQEAQELTQTRDKLMEERRTLAEVIRQEFADRLVMTEEENRKMKVEMSEVRARLRLEVEKVTREKEEELAEVHQRVKSAILKKEETVSNLRKQYEAALKRADHLEALWDQQRKQLLGK
ncbi:centrosomal protein of 131 kDa isoform X1 [Cynoglossus semilaevis]|uniref:centrosomal protein of 131 kDa isoform X1 n=1 Tax=Cynoglossus semilaevis TaxID=244447 RepID=UPI0007DC9F90|nr:centrosomal protein of 131 kDa isoform X1 [Cynoglossus semilaevis]XP_024913943.1 centrosomal protein of 131 kDa isoform X1 [Cynoglossus semilaevis]